MAVAIQVLACRNCVFMKCFSGAAVAGNLSGQTASLQPVMATIASAVNAAIITAASEIHFL